MKIEAFDKFEYKCETFAGFSMSKVVEELNNLGAEGWECEVFGNADYDW